MVKVLLEKSQSVCQNMNGSTSEPNLVECGVPQGSVLGPQLDLLYTTPIADLFRKHRLSFNLCTEDDQVCSSFPCQD